MESQSCDAANCQAHGEMETDVKSFKLLVTVFGFAISILLIWLISLSSEVDKGLQAHKEASLRSYSEVQLQVKDLTGAVNITNNNFEHIQQDIQTLIKRLPISTLAEAEDQDHSTLWFAYE